jgi:hypothetical protein
MSLASTFYVLGLLTSLGPGLVNNSIPDVSGKIKRSVIFAGGFLLVFVRAIRYNQLDVADWLSGSMTGRRVETAVHGLFVS